MIIIIISNNRSSIIIIVVINNNNNNNNKHIDLLFGKSTIKIFYQFSEVGPEPQ